MTKARSLLAAAALLAALGMAAPAVAQGYFDMGGGNGSAGRDATSFSPVPPGSNVGGTPGAAAGQAPSVRGTGPALPVPSDYSIPGGSRQAPRPAYAPVVDAQAGYPVAPPPDPYQAAPAQGFDIGGSGMSGSYAPAPRAPAASTYASPPPPGGFAPPTPPAGYAPPSLQPPQPSQAQNIDPSGPMSGANLPLPLPPPVGTQPPPGGGGFQMTPGQPAPPRQQAASAQRGGGRPAAPNRFIVPYSKLRLEGEVDARTWTMFLTQDEAASAATLSIGYINAVMVMPEASRLRVSINNQLVLDTPITSSSKPARMSVQLHSGLLRPGGNIVRMEALQRHRTDCNYQATYELWTDIISDMTGLSFGNGTAVALRNLEDLPSVGVDAQGRTNIRLVVAGGMNTAIGDRVLRLGQAIAVRGRFPHPIVTVTDRPPGPMAGALNVMIGPANDLARTLGASFPGAGNRSLVTFINDPRLPVPTLVVTGLTWSDVDNTIAQVEQPLMQTDDGRSRFFDTATWLTPNVSILTGATSLRLSDLDIGTQEFSGRRFHVRFAIGLPVDFYASAYGQAMLYLDAAYSGAVRQSSHFDIYVNGNIASTVDLDSGDGDILRHSPVKIPMKHFRPGVNEIVLEAILVTNEDARCGPAATIPGANRLVLFNTTEFWMPSFARIARLPNLDAFSATGFPYNKAEQTALVLAKPNAQNYSAAGTLLARVARSWGRPIPVDSSATLQTIADRPAIFVGLAGDLPPAMFSELSVSDKARTEWMLTGIQDQAPARTTERPTAYSAVVPQNPDAQRPGQTPTGPRETSPAYPDVFANETQGGNRQVYDRWNDTLAGGRGLRGEVERVGNWFEDTFDLSYSSLRLVDPRPELFEPTADMSIFLAQGDKSGGVAPWTVLAGRSATAMGEGLARLTAPEIWSGVAGRVTSYEPARQTISIEPTSEFHFVVTEPIGFSNARLILANWMSTNVLIYALTVLVFCIVLGVGTSELLARVGRRP